VHIEDYKPQAVDWDSLNWVQRILDLPFRRHRIWFPFTAALWGGLVYALGWLWARHISFGDDYLATHAIWVTCLNISWVLGSVFWGLRWLPKLIDSLEKCFLDAKYDEFASKWKARFLSDGWMLLFAVVVLTFGATTMYFAMFHQPSAAHHVLPSSWFHGNPVSKFALLVMIGLCASLATGSGMSLFFVNLPFVFALRALSVVSLPNFLLAKLRPLSDFYLAGTLTWFAAVGLSALILFPNLSNSAIWFLLVTTVIGLSGFIVPQIVFHVLVVRAQSQLADSVYAALLLRGSDRDPIRDSSILKDLNDTVKANSVWVFDRTDITALLIPELISAVGLILKSGLFGQHS
jgi:hypothetical protein